MQFGFTLKPEHTIERTLALTRQAEAAGFEYGWLFDTHVLWREPYVLLTLMAQAHRAAAARDVRHEPGDPRAVGHRVRAGRPRRDRPAAGWTWASAAATRPGASSASRRRRWPRSRRRSTSSGASSRAGRSTYEGTELQLPVDRQLDAAGLGRRLRPDGPGDDRPGRRRASSSSSPTRTSIRWFVGQVREAATAAGRPAGSVKVQAAAPAHVGDRATVPRADALVPGARLEPRRRPRQQVPARAAAASR